MKKLLILIPILFTLNACLKNSAPSSFTEKALKEEFIGLEAEKIEFKQILKNHLGRVVLIDVWASWCPDCIISFPDVKQLQNDFPNVEYIFLSADKTESDWKNAIEKYDLTGHHYLIQDGMKGNFGKAINLDWIPRYIVIDQKGDIALYKAIEANSKELITILKKLN